MAGQYCWALMGLAGVSQVCHIPASVVLPLWSCLHSSAPVVLLPQSFPCDLDVAAAAPDSGFPTTVCCLCRLSVLKMPHQAVLASVCQTYSCRLGSVCPSRGLPAPWALPWE